MKASKLAFFVFLTAHVIPTAASDFSNYGWFVNVPAADDGDPWHARSPHPDRTKQDNEPLNGWVSCEENFSKAREFANLLDFKLTSTQLLAFTQSSQAAFEIAQAHDGNVTISELKTNGQPTILIRIDLHPEELNGSYKLQFSASQIGQDWEIQVPRIEIRVEPERIVIFQARAPALRIGNTITTSEVTSHGNAFIVVYPGANDPVIDSGIVPSRMVLNSKTLLGSHCLEIAKSVGLRLSSSGQLYLRTRGESFSLSDKGWIPLTPDEI